MFLARGGDRLVTIPSTCSEEGWRRGRGREAGRTGGSGLEVKCELPRDQQMGMSGTVAPAAWHWVPWSWIRGAGGACGRVLLEETLCM